MALNISAWSIRNPLPSIVFSIILLVLGWVSFTKLAVTRLPSADIPVISVAVSQFGAAPAELESQVTKTIEDGVSGVEGVRHISSSITDGLSLTTIQFALETNTDRALNDVKDAVTRVRSQPAAERQRAADPARRRDRPADRHLCRDLAGQDAGATVLFRRRRGQTRAAGRAQRRPGRAHRRRRARDPGLARSRPAAGRGTDRGRCQPEPARHQCRSRRRPRRNRQERPGDPHAGRRQDAERSRRHHDQLFGGGEVRLDDLGTVTDTIADRRTFARFNGEPVVALGIKRSKGASDVVVAAAVQKRIDALKAAYPDVDLKLIDTSVDFTKGNYEAAISTLFEGAILAVIIVLPVPARHPRHRHRRDLAAAVDFPGVLGDGHSRLLAQPGQLPRHHAVDRYSGRRRHRRDREHRAPHADGQIALSRGAGGRRRDRPRRDRDQPDHHRDLRAGELHVRHRRAVLQAVRHHRVGAGVLLAARRALRHAGAGRLLPEGSRPRRSAAGTRAARPITAS